MARMITRQEAAKMLDVDIQTISNWIEKGALTGHYVHSKRQGKEIVLVDKNSIERYFDSLSEISIMENKISLLKNTLSDLQDSLKHKVSDMSCANYLFGNGISQHLLQRVFDCIIDVAGDNLLVERERSILYKLVIRNWSPSELAEEYGLSATRIMQIVNRAVFKICTMQKWPDFHRDHKSLLKENKKLLSIIDNLQVYIKHLEQQLNISKDDDGGESAIKGYTKQALAEVLSRRLSDVNLSSRTLNCLKSADVEDISQLIRLRVQDLLKFRNFGKKSLNEINSFLEGLNLSLGMNVSAIIDAQVEDFLMELRNKEKR